MAPGCLSLSPYSQQNKTMNFMTKNSLPLSLPVKHYHNHIATCHTGQWKTYELVSREFWWPGIFTFMKSYVDRCATCQATKMQPRNKVPLQPNQIPTDIWGIITMDFITDLPVSQGFNSLFIVVDCLSKATICPQPFFHRQMAKQNMSIKN